MKRPIRSGKTFLLFLVSILLISSLDAGAASDGLTTEEAPPASPSRAAVGLHGRCDSAQRARSVGVGPSFRSQLTHVRIGQLAV